MPSLLRCQPAATFRENAINEKVLPNLTAEDLKDMGIGIVGHRRILSTPSRFCGLKNLHPRHHQRHHRLRRRCSSRKLLASAGTSRSCSRQLALPSFVLFSTMVLWSVLLTLSLIRKCSVRAAGLRPNGRFAAKASSAGSIARGLLVMGKQNPARAQRFAAEFKLRSALELHGGPKELGRPKGGLPRELAASVSRLAWRIGFQDGDADRGAPMRRSFSPTAAGRR